jgi:hypothetical protein
MIFLAIALSVVFVILVATIILYFHVKRERDHWQEERKITFKPGDLVYCNGKDKLREGIFLVTYVHLMEGFFDPIFQFKFDRNILKEGINPSRNVNFAIPPKFYLKKIERIDK